MPLALRTAEASDEEGTGTLTDSAINNNYCDGEGGNLYNGGTLTVNNCAIIGADTRLVAPTALGGCVFNDSGTGAFTNCTIADGNAGLNGGDVQNNTSAILDLTDCLVTGGTTGANGGGLYNLGNATLTNCTVSGNIAGDGGGGIQNGASQPTSILTVLDSTISGNSSGQGGGGLATDGIATLTACTIANNSGNTSNQGFLYSGGGGIDNKYIATLVACTVSGNNISNQGGSVFTEGGGGIYAGGYGSKVTLNDSIVAGNTTTTSSGTSPSDLSAKYGAIIKAKAIVAGSNNLIGTFYLNDTPDTWSVVGSNNISLGNVSDPPSLGLAPLGDYGGPTETMALMPGSIAIGNGSQALEVDANDNPLTGDQRGFPFDSPNPDIGAYQDGQFPLVVSVATDGVGARLRQTRLARRRQSRQPPGQPDTDHIRSDGFRHGPNDHPCRWSARARATPRER